MVWWGYNKPVDPEDEEGVRQRREERAHQGALKDLVWWLITYGIMVAAFVALVLLVRWLT